MGKVSLADIKSEHLATLVKKGFIGNVYSVAPGSLYEKGKTYYNCRSEAYYTVLDVVYEPCLSEEGKLFYRLKSVFVKWQDGGIRDFNVGLDSDDEYMVDLVRHDKCLAIDCYGDGVYDGDLVIVKSTKTNGFTVSGKARFVSWDKPFAIDYGPYYLKTLEFNMMDPNTQHEIMKIKMPEPQVEYDWMKD